MKKIKVKIYVVTFYNPKTGNSHTVTSSNPDYRVESCYFELDGETVDCTGLWKAIDYTPSEYGWVVKIETLEHVVKINL